MQFSFQSFIHQIPFKNPDVHQSISSSGSSLSLDNVLLQYTYVIIDHNIFFLFFVIDFVYHIT